MRFIYRASQDAHKGRKRLKITSKYSELFMLNLPKYEKRRFNQTIRKY